MEKNAKSFKGAASGTLGCGWGEQSGVCLCIVFTEHCEALLYYALWLWRFWSLSWFNWIKTAGCVRGPCASVCAGSERGSGWVLIPDECISTQGRTALNLHTYTYAQKVKKSCWSYLGEVITLSSCPCQIPHINLGLSHACHLLDPVHLGLHLHLISRALYANQNKLATWKCQRVVIWLWESML